MDGRYYEVYRFEKNLNKLELLNPLLTIGRGYSITRKDEKVISSIKEIQPKDKLEVQLKDGFIFTEVIDTKKKRS